MANLTDPLIRAVQGSDPQNLMEYITRQRIYDSRFWKEECFGLTAADVLEKAAKSLACIGGTMGASQKPTKFICLILKLLQLQPDLELIQEEFVQQEHFKYVRVLGAFYLRLTGRPADIYTTLEPLYKDFSKLRLRDTSEWKLTHMDQVVHDLLTQSSFVGIALPRLPARITLQQEGYIDDGPRKTALEEAIMHAGGLEALLQYKVHVQKSPAAIKLWDARTPASKDKTTLSSERYTEYETLVEENHLNITATSEIREEATKSKRKSPSYSDDEGARTKNNKKPKKDKAYGNLFKTENRTNRTKDKPVSDTLINKVSEGSDEYWNEQRAKLGLKPLNKEKH